MQCTAVYSRRSDTEASGAVPIARSGRVDGEDNGIGAGLFRASQQLLGLGVILIIQVELHWWISIASPISPVLEVC